MTTARLMVNKETSDEDLTNIIADKKAAYEKAKAEEEARRKAQEEARKKAEQKAAAKKRQQQQQKNISPAKTGNKAEYQQYAHDLVINTYG